MKETLQARLTQHGQQHLLAFWDALPQRQQALARQIESLDLELISRLYRGAADREDWAALASRAASPPAFRLDGKQNPFTPDEARKRGWLAIADGQMGVILVAGGQGTRLGFDHPKGMFPIGPVSGATLFQILFEKLIACARRAGVRIPLYLMTSPATHDETVAYLRKVKNFGLPSEDLTIFCQGTMPAVDAATGRILLAERDQLFLSPDGHGGTLAALASSNSLPDIQRRGIRHLFYCQVDNPLVTMCDPEFIGYHLLSEAEISTQVVAKRASREKVGNVVLIDGKLRIIEYSDLNPLADDIVERRAADGSPVFWAGSTAIHVFNAAFLRRMAASADSLPFHLAKKTVPYVDGSGQQVEPKEPNAIKFERFIFDLLPSARKGIVMEVDGEVNFAPVKNAPSEKHDTPASVQSQLLALHRRWLRDADCRVADGVKVEISPLFALDAQEVRAKVQPGLVVNEDRCLC